MLDDCIDHEIVHVNDYASGRKARWLVKHADGGNNIEKVSPITEFRAYSRNKWFNNNSDIDDSIEMWRKQLPNGFSTSLVFER